MEQASGFLARQSSMDGYTAQEKRCGVQEYLPTLFIISPSFSFLELSGTDAE